MKNFRLAGAAMAGLGAALALRTVHRLHSVDFRGASVVITGGSRGLGLVMARDLAGQGARLTLLARDSAELSRAADELVERGAEVLALPCDVSDQDSIRDAVARIIERFGRIDVLINNAGVIQSGPVEHMTLDDFDNALAIHFWGPLYMMYAALPHMRRQGSGRIVNIASIGGKIAVPHLLPYCASKFALVGLSDGMRAELAKDGIRVTTVCPGLMRTGSHGNAQFKGQHNNEFAWFAVLDSLPFSSIDARRAAHQIIEACRRGDPELVISIQAKALARLSPLFPRLTAHAMALMNRLLPGPTNEEGDVVKTGWESRSPQIPSLLTRLSDRAAEANNGLRGQAPPA